MAHGITFHPLLSAPLPPPLRRQRAWQIHLCTICTWVLGISNCPSATAVVEDQWAHLRTVCSGNGIFTYHTHLCVQLCTWKHAFWRNVHILPKTLIIILHRLLTPPTLMHLIRCHKNDTAANRHHVGWSPLFSTLSNFCPNLISSTKLQREWFSRKTRQECVTFLNIKIFPYQIGDPRIRTICLCECLRLSLEKGKHCEGKIVLSLYTGLFLT